MSVVAKQLQYSQHGEPTEVLKIVEKTLDAPTGNQVLVRILAAPINPADVLTVKGKYAVKVKFPAVGGNEFVGVVKDVGEQVTKLRLGQHVVPFESGVGTWKTHAVLREDQLMAIHSKIDIAEAATLTVNSVTAYRMLKDFVKLLPGDCVIQNGANSAVGQAVHQLCRVWGIKSIGIVRNRPGLESLKEYLKDLGATEVLTEEELAKTQLFSEGLLAKPKLALNCVGGKSATEIVKHLADKSVMVTYGALTAEPIQMTTAELIYRDISFRGFWRTRWTAENRNSAERQRMFTELFELMRLKKFVAPLHELVPLEQFKTAFTIALNSKGYVGKKYILDMLNE